MLFFPTSFFLGSLYTESLFILLTTLSIYSAKKQNWFKAALATSALAITRVVGILLIPVLVFIWWQDQNHQKLNEAREPSKTQLINKALRELWPVLLAPLSLIAYAFYNFKKWGRALYFLESHTFLGNSRSIFTNPLRTLYHYGQILLEFNYRQHEWRLAIFELLTIFFVLTLLVKAWKNKLKPSYQILAWLLFLVPFISGTFSGLPRYSLIIFPLFLTLAQTEKKWQWLYLFFSIPLLVISVILFSRGYFIA